MFRQDGHDVAGISQQQPGVPSVWNNYITVEDVDALAGRVAALGGKVVVPPFEVMENGRMMTLQDPGGAYVCLWQARSHIGGGLVNVPGAMTWNELSAPHTDQATAFYGGLLGWTFEIGQMPGYTFIYNRGRINGGIVQMTQEWAGIPPHWMTYFSVASIDDAVAKVTAHGGKLTMPLIDAPGTGRFGVIADPQGAIFTLIQLENPMPWNE
jgi:hypothetical protein